MKLEKLVTGEKLEHSQNMEIKQYIPEWPMGQGRSQKGNKKLF